MIRHIHIENYALIEHVEVDFEDGFTAITGETGAGKSILVNAVSLALGQRADSSVLFDKNKKTVIEIEFDMGMYSLQNLFEEADIDYDTHCIIRRELTPQGKSRSFVNDTPVNNTVLKNLGEALIEIHSQHGNLLLQNADFQLFIIDQYAKTAPLLSQYKQVFDTYKKVQKEYKKLSELSGNQDKDYLQFIFDELYAAHIKEGEKKVIEEEYQLLSNAEEIKTKLFETANVLNINDENIIEKLQECRQKILSIEKHSEQLKTFSQRLTSLIFELKDLATDIEHLAENTVNEPQRAEDLNNRLNVLYHLEQKHRVATEAELLDIQHLTEQKLDQIAMSENQLENLQKQIHLLEKELLSLSQKLSRERQKAIPAIVAAVKIRLEEMNMAQVSLEIVLSQGDKFTESGIDKPTFLFNANKGGIMQEISKAASGGELSRLMLSLKSLILQKNQFPSIIFDEIDAGVSGEVSAKMAKVMQEISHFTQLIAITHLPQIASKAKHHYLVYKEVINNKTLSFIKKLNEDERVVEIAKMISNEVVTQSSLETAKNLIHS